MALGIGHLAVPCVSRCPLLLRGSRQTRLRYDLVLFCVSEYSPHYLDICHVLCPTWKLDRSKSLLAWRTTIPNLRLHHDSRAGHLVVLRVWYDDPSSHHEADLVATEARGQR